MSIPRRISTFFAWHDGFLPWNSASYADGVITAVSFEGGGSSFHYYWIQRDIDGNVVTPEVNTNGPLAFNTPGQEGYRNLNFTFGGGTLLDGVPYYWVHPNASGVPVKGANISNSVEGDDVRYVPSGNQGIYINNYAFLLWGCDA